MEDDLKRPYAAAANVMAVIERCRTRNLPDTIDDEVFRIAGIGPAVFGRVRQTLQFLNLTGGDNTPTDLLRAISKAPAGEYRQLLESAVREAYADDFGGVDPAQDSQLQVFESFRKYEPRSQTARMVMLFLGLCREAGIAVQDAPRERKMQRPSAARGGAVRMAAPKSRTTRATTGAAMAEPGDSAMMSGLLFGVSEDDIAALDPSDFDEVWAALGKVALARANSRKAVRASAAAPSAVDGQ